MHSAFCKEGVKEKHYFSTDNWLDKGSIQRFKNEFMFCKPEELTVDATPSLIGESLVPARVHASYTPESLGKKKFIVLFREPAARHYSEYQRLVRGCLVLDEDSARIAVPSRSKSVEEREDTAEKKCNFILNDPDKKHTVDNLMTFKQWTASDYGQKQLHRGFYFRQIVRWLTVIARRQLFIVNFDSLIANTTDVLTRMSVFLGVDPAGWPRVLNDTKILLPEPPASDRYSDHEKTKMDCQTYDNLYGMWKQSNSGIEEFVNNDRSGRPPTEPSFPTFKTSRSKCVSAVWIQTPPQNRGWFNITPTHHTL